MARLLVITILCCGLQLQPALANNAANSAKNNPAASEQQLNKLKTDISELQKWLNNARGKRQDVQNELRKIEVEIGRIATNIKQTNAQIQLTRNQLSQLNAQRQELLKAKQTQARYLAQQIRAAYSIGRQEYFKVLLNQQSPDQLARALRYYDYFNQARAEQINAYSETIEQLRQNQEQTLKQQDNLQTARQNLEKKRSAINNSRKQRRQILVRIESGIQNKGVELEKLLADRAQLRKLLEAVEQTIAEAELPEASVPINQLKGRLPWPTQGKVVRRFGSRDTLQSARWNGVLIEAGEGRDVVAIHHGHVVFSDWLRGFGLLVIIDHGNNYMSLYGQNQALYKEVGDWVNANEVIASVGSSGGQARSGLYFEIRQNGKPQDPQGWILARK